jgi:hypothetical protein
MLEHVFRAVVISGGAPHGMGFVECGMGFVEGSQGHASSLVD